MSIPPDASAKTFTQVVAMEIRVAMTRADVRQSELARRIGKTEQWLSVRLRGRQAIDLNDLALIAHGLAVSPLELLPAPEVVAAVAGQINER
jgi:transcriptional regulator with XRE-family HTH domain